MFSAFLAKDAFAQPLDRKDTFPKNYNMLYQHESVAREYVKENKDNEKFKNQFNKQLDMLKEWGIKNNCADAALVEKINSRKLSFFSSIYSGNQPATYFSVIKQNLENILFILSYDKSILEIKKKDIYKNLFNNISAWEIVKSKKIINFDLNPVSLISLSILA